METTNGQYFDQCEPDNYAEAEKDVSLRRRLWQKSEELLKSN